MADKGTLQYRIDMAIEELEDRFEELKADKYYDDTLHEIADGCVPIYHSELLQIAANDCAMGTNEPELGPAFDGKPTPVNIIAANIYEALMEALTERWRELVEEDEAKEEDD